LREFKIVTGLPCGKFPTTKKKKKGTVGKIKLFYNKLFSLEDDVTVDRVIALLKKKIVSNPDIRLGCAYLILVDGFLLPTSHYPKIVKAHAEIAEDLNAFLAFPWGGLLYAMQLVVLQAAPAIQEGPVMGETIDYESDGEDEDVEVETRESVPFKLGNAQEVDNFFDVNAPKSMLLR